MIPLAILGAATGVQKQYASLGMTIPFLGDRVHDVDHLAFRKAMLAEDMSVWEGLHISPPGAPSRGAKLCTYLQWFAWPYKLNSEPYYELTLPVTKLRSVVHFRMGACALSIEQGRIGKRKVPRQLRGYPFCTTNAMGQERHCGFDCPHFEGLWQQDAELLQDSHDTLRSFMWHEDQKSVSACAGHCQTALDIMPDSSAWAFRGCMDVVTLLLLLLQAEVT